MNFEITLRTDDTRVVPAEITGAPAGPGQPTVSVVVPVFNSAATLPELTARVAAVLELCAREYELILVNDGSRDDSWRVIEELHTVHSFIRGINLMRNFGQHNALLCGVRAARHDVVVTLDDDLQHPPEEIPRLLEKLQDGLDVVYGAPAEMPHSVSRNILSRVTKLGLSMAMGIPNIRDISAFRAFRTSLRRAFTNYKSPNVLLDVLLSWGTTRFGAIHVEHRPRQVGNSGYTLGRLFNQAMLIFTGFSTGPLRLASLVGFCFTLIGIAVFTYAVGVYFVYDALPGFPFLASIISVFSGAQLFALGIMGEYLARMFNRSMERPVYLVQDTLGQSTETSVATRS